MMGNVEIGQVCSGIAHAECPVKPYGSHLHFWQGSCAQDIRASAQGDALLTCQDVVDVIVVAAAAHGRCRPRRHPVPTGVCEPWQASATEM